MLASRLHLFEKVDGEWGEWGGWEVCSKKCGTGKTKRTRECDDPAPEHGGNNCTGSDIQEKGRYLAHNTIFTCHFEADCVDWKYFPRTKKCYKRFDRKEWPEALRHCRKEATGGNLASIPDSKTEEFLKGLSKYFWTGGKRNGSLSAWWWTDGSPWSFTNWNIGHPEAHNKKHWAFHRGDKEKWEARPFTEKQPFICQYPNQ